MTNFEYYKQYYNILNVPYDSDINSIKKSFRTLSLKYHPDKFKENKELAEACSNVLNRLKEKYVEN